MLLMQSAAQADLASFDSNVPLLAIEAANEIDELVVGRNVPLNAVRQLTEVLQHSFPSDSGNGQNYFVDSGSVAVFSEAFNGVSGTGAISSLEQLRERVRAFKAALHVAKPASNEGEIEQLKNLRALCLALASSAASFRNSIYEAHPPHPFEA